MRTKVIIIISIVLGYATMVGSNDDWLYFISDSPKETVTQLAVTIFAIFCWKNIISFIYSSFEDNIK